MPVLQTFRAGSAAVIVLCAGVITGAADTPISRLAAQLRPLHDCLSGRRESFCLTAQIDMEIDRTPQRIEARLVRYDAAAFDLEVVHSEYAIHLRRRAEATALALPKHEVVFIGRGEVDASDQLQPQGMAARLLSTGSMLAAYGPLVLENAPEALAPLLVGLLKASYDAESAQWTAGRQASFRFADSGQGCDVRLAGSHVRVEIAAEVPAPPAVEDWPGFKFVALDRRELERQLARGARRALEILAPSPRLTAPEPAARKVEHGEVRWIDGHRVALLKGTPEQIGRAHAELLREEALRCMDSVLHTFGTAQTIRTGRWFRHDLEAAHARLSPHIPPAHQRELRALAEALRLDPGLVETTNVFPELFHCSGFAVFGKATKDGKLYHGRVLDYMTTIGLQDAATTFIVAVEGKIPFANVGYAGFVGSVSGMNARGISLGEMGGRGEGQWDGVPMATLMRRALEECGTLEDVMQLWKTNPRTCEYYYVFADGKTRRAVGVAATPQSLEFIFPGQSDPRLGEGIEDAVVLSAGSRLEKLRERVQERYGQFDVEAAQWLMCRPVAMQSNLHNVLFVPEDGVLYVASADHRHPAADRPYVRVDLGELLKSMPAAGAR